MSNPFIPIKTADIDWRHDLPYSLQFDDIYYSAESGIKQSRYVFIDGNNLIDRWQRLPVDKSSVFTIAETGFGTGMNFLLTWKLWEQFAPQKARLHYISCDKHPLKQSDLIKCLQKWPELDAHATKLIEHYPILTPGYHYLTFNNGQIVLTLMLGDALECYEQLLLCGDNNLEPRLRNSHIDAWYLDGFSPSKNQAMWSDNLLAVFAMLSKEGTTLATYTAASRVKTALNNAGFAIEKRKGFGPKRHMICASYQKTPSFFKKYRHTPWHVGCPVKQNTNSAIVVGGGLAGCFTASALAKRGWTITLIEEKHEVGQCGSANQQAVLFPKLSSYNSPFTQFMLFAFLYANQVYKRILDQFKIGELKGCLLLAHNDKEKRTQHSLIQWLTSYPELGRLVDEQEATELAGLHIRHCGLHIPLSGWINSPELCNILINDKRISLINNMKINSIHFDKKNWVVNNFNAPILILANGQNVNHFRETEYLPVKAIRGQMTTIQSTQSSSRLRIPLCAEGHVLPSRNSTHMVGATYGIGISEPLICIQDDQANLERLKQIAPETTWSDHALDHWAGVRAASPDYLPIVGAIPKVSEFEKVYSGLHTNSKRWIAQSGPYYPGLYACAAFGSRGLTTIPLAAEWLACLINNEISILPRKLIQAISPARFLRKRIIQGL
ncbi:FAD-dependent cmnm(5)s(2)U34 oxidoreductase [Legionella norrlandica]|uniref:tRNA 5-methylaminomethyl-2-thiouridine biosynthesis bifunctional protein MnmC n=1 Tax=Legionella norrlandica TaxID=1498499 RepID=A0A0A2SVQ7_9GAMM|nr:bifunctional tRNA (5-methylaminomethyl-2-thiouridine)(34)-methyltransferase MnmD/FAD-dependent 5-carboxymethylaminomethyl-2-thiouridine(34) oxidoreductase MnmC [Legionella norrlandica]KGP63806.1 FAD-dependent cmnm(5)s(2)U34 oxidoreductase [Legionella norrlandica]